MVVLYNMILLCRGWRSWNQIGGSTTQAIMEAQMVAITSRNYTVNGVPTSLADLGYTDVGLDDYWQKCGSYGADKFTYHTELGTPVVDESANKYPNMLAMTTKGHDAGLTVGWYGACHGPRSSRTAGFCSCIFPFSCCSSLAGNNCGCSDHCTDEKCFAGDVAAAFEFGYDSIKLDGCGKEYDLDLWASLLNSTGKPFMIENCACVTHACLEQAGRRWQARPPSFPLPPPMRSMRCRPLGLHRAQRDLVPMALLPRVWRHPRLVRLRHG